MILLMCVQKRQTDKADRAFMMSNHEFIIFLTYSSYIEAYEVQKKNKVLRQGSKITITELQK